MIDLATTTGANTPVLLPDPAGYSFWVERPTAGPFVEGTTIGFTAVGQELEEGPKSWIKDDKEISRSDALLDEIVTRSRQDVERYPSSARTRANLGLALLNRGKLEDAATEFTTALQLDPRHYVAAANLARTRVIQGRLTEGQKLYNLLRDDHPIDPGPIMGLAAIAEREGDLEEAVRLWQQAIQLRPNSAAAHSNLATTFLRLGCHREAIASLKLAVRIEARRATIHHALGVAYALAGQQSKAVRSLRMALALNPRMADGVQSLAAVLLSQGRALEAVEALEVYVADATGDFEAHEQLASAYAELNNYQAARRQWFRALEALGRSGHDMRLDQARLINNLGVCFLQLGALDEAHKRFQESIRLSPDDPAPYQNLARLYFKKASYFQDAATVLRTCAKRFPDDEETRLMLAYALQMGSEGREAVVEMEDWVALGNATARAWTALGFLLTDVVHQPARAVHVLEEARRKWSEDGMLANNLAYAYLMNEDPESARAVLESLPKDADWQTSATAVVLRATWGLLRLWEGDFKAAELGYRKATEEAERQGLGELARTAQQKMHLELARAYQRAGNADAARQIARKGLTLPGERHYRRELSSILEKLRAAASQTRPV